MTELITNNYEALNNAFMTSKSKSAVNGSMDYSACYTAVVDKQNNLKKIDTKEFKKDNNAVNEQDDKISDFKKKLSDVIDEVKAENSLELTLDRDINDIIDQLQSVKEDTISNDKTAFNSLSAIFEQIRTIADVAKTIDPTGVYDEILQKADEIVNSALKNVIDCKIADAKELTNDFDALEKYIDEDILKDLNIESVQAETDTSAGDSMFSGNNMVEHSIKVMLNHVNDKFEIPQNNSKDVVVKDVSPEKIIEQINKQIDAMRSGSKVNIVLNPQALGRVNLQIINTNEGLSAQFTVTTNEARDLLMRGLEGLKEVLNAQGISVDSLNVKLSEAQESEYRQDWTEREGSQGGNKNQQQPNKEEKEKGLFEKTIAKNLKDI